jgi:predicted ATPase
MSDIKIKSLTIKGFKSIQTLDKLEPGQINILIGSNGAGKSNFISFFRMLSWCVSSVDQFQNFIANAGFASSLLFDGSEVTREIESHLVLETESGLNEYASRLVHGAGDILFFADEKVRFSRQGLSPNPNWTSLGAGHKESKLFEFSTSDNTVRTISNLLRKIVVHQFHNTSQQSPIRNRWAANDGRWLKENGGNLGSFLFRLYQEYPNDYKRIVKHIRLVLPFFDDFVLENERGYVMLRWKEWDSPPKIFDASQASDGMLRFIAVVALLAQPIKYIPAVIFIDEPELGLHPSAIASMAGLVKTASRHCQIFISTQSPTLIDMFEPGDIIVVERRNRASIFNKLNNSDLEAWLAEYSLSELWEKNIIGGKP